MSEPITFEDMVDYGRWQKLDVGDPLPGAPTPQPSEELFELGERFGVWEGLPIAVSVEPINPEDQQ